MPAAEREQKVLALEQLTQAVRQAHRHYHDDDIELFASLVEPEREINELVAECYEVVILILLIFINYAEHSLMVKLI
jgi:hypothetical protein